jgi:PTS system mannitol-specific IIC component
VIVGAGLVATPSPGSIFAYLAVTPPGQHFGVLTGVLIAAVASFGVGSFILKVYPVRDPEAEDELEEAEPYPEAA